MKKADFLKQENVPEFIKEIVRNAPDDAEVDIMEMKVGRKPEGSGCCCDRENEDGVDISAYLEGIAERAAALVDLTDCKGRVARCDLDKVLGQVDVLFGTVAQLYNFVSNEPKEGNKSCSQKE